MSVMENVVLSVSAIIPIIWQTVYPPWASLRGPLWCTNGSWIGNHRYLFYTISSPGSRPDGWRESNHSVLQEEWKLTHFTLILNQAAFGIIFLWVCVCVFDSFFMNTLIWDWMNGKRNSLVSLLPIKVALCILITSSLHYQDKKLYLFPWRKTNTGSPCQWVTVSFSINSVRPNL